VPEARQWLRDLRVFVDQAAESIASDHLDGRVRGYLREGSKRRSLSQGPVRPMGVEMGLVLTQHPAGEGGIHDQDQIRTGRERGVPPGAPADGRTRSR
jgi:hypothetical protein